MWNVPLQVNFHSPSLYLREGRVTTQIYIADKLHDRPFSTFHNFSKKLGHMKSGEGRKEGEITLSSLSQKSEKLNQKLT